jgi:hypothetical protein
LEKRAAAAAAAKPAAKPKRSVVAEPADGEEDTSGESEQAKQEFERKARETSLAPFQPNLKTQYLRETGAVARGGRRRRRMKTGRRI